MRDLRACFLLQTERMGISRSGGPASRSCLGLLEETREEKVKVNAPILLQSRMSKV